MRRIVLVAFILTAFAACQPADTELTDYQKGEIEAEVNLELETMWDLFRQADYDHGIAYWEDSPEQLFGTSEGGILKGFAAIDAAFRPGFTTIASQVLNVDETHITVITQDVVYVMQRGTYAATDTSGVTDPTRPFAYSYLWTRTDAGWKVSSAHMSTGDPMEE